METAFGYIDKHFDFFVSEIQRSLRQPVVSDKTIKKVQKRC